MAAPAYGAAGTYLSGSGASAAVPVPAGVAAGHIIVVVLYLDGGGSVTGLPSGFAHVTGSPFSVPPGGGQHSMAVAWKRASGADTGTYDFTLAGSIFREAGAHSVTDALASGDPWDATDSGINTVNNTVSPDVDLTTTGADRLLVFAASNWGGGAWTPPSGYAERMDTGEHLITLATKAQAVAGATGTVTATSATSDKGTAFLGALKPAAGGLTQAIGVAVETNTAQALGKRKTRTVGVVAETSTARPLAKTKTKAVGQASETSTAQPLGRTKTRALGVTTTTETAQPFGKAKTRALGTAVEVNAAQPLGGQVAPSPPPRFDVGQPRSPWSVGQPRTPWSLGPLH